MKKIILILAVLFMAQSVFSQLLSDWRGTERTGKYLDEKNLLKQWPDNGPELVWSVDSLPKAYSSVAVVNGTVFLTGIKDSLDYLLAFDKFGHKLWEVAYGRAWNASFPDARCSPTIEGNRIYLSSGSGDVACVDTTNGNLIWTVNASERFGGSFGEWGISESILLVDDKAIFTPGGSRTTMVALNKETGETVWETESLNDKPSYTSPLLVNHNGIRFISTTTEQYLIGVNPDDGKILWKFDYGKYGAHMWNTIVNINANTHLYSDGYLYINNGYNHKNVMLKLSEKADSVSLVRVDSVLDVHHGGLVKVGDYVYGANWINNAKGNWVCMQWETGKIMYEHKWNTKGSIIYADGMLYCYDEKRGNIALVKPNPEKFDIVSSFRIEKGRGPHWSHPVISDGLLYIRHQDALMVFDIRAEK